MQVGLIAVYLHNKLTIGSVQETNEMPTREKYQSKEQKHGVQDMRYPLF